MIKASEKTIVPKTPIKSWGDESAKCSGSSRRDPRSDFSTSIPPSTTPSTINDISSLGPQFGSSEPKQPPSGKMRLPSHETRFDLAASLHPARYRDNADGRGTRSRSRAAKRNFRPAAAAVTLDTIAARREERGCRQKAQ